MKKKSIDINHKKSRRNIVGRILFFNGKFDFLSLIKNIFISFGGGLLISVLVRNTMYVYDGLKKPIFTPPKIVFPFVWTIIYIIIGIAAYRIYMNNKLGKSDFGGYFYYLIGLLLNFLWAIIFFGLRLYGISFMLIIIMLAFIIVTTIKFLKVDKIAGLLMIPYGLWVSFAALLSFYIWVLNEM
jgi:tryptophan-rich sensory protein